MARAFALIHSHPRLALAAVLAALALSESWCSNHPSSRPWWGY